VLILGILVLPGDTPVDTTAQMASGKGKGRRGARRDEPGTGIGDNPLIGNNLPDPRGPRTVELALLALAEWQRHQQDIPTINSVQENELTTFQSFRRRSPTGDRLEGHELWQHANLNEHGLVGAERLSTVASQQNPVIALSRAVHLRVGEAQRALNARSMTPLQNIRENARILRELNAAPRRTIDELERRALEHARSYGFKR
jgi:hypothetical protein